MARSVSAAAATCRTRRGHSLRGPPADDLDLTLEVGMGHPVVQAAPLQGVVDVPGPVGGDDHPWRDESPERAELGHGHGVLGEDLEQEGLELVVGPVDLVDEQDRRRPVPVVDGGEKGPAHEETLGVDGVGHLTGGRSIRPGDLGRPQVQELAGVVPLVDGLRHVDALVALEPQQRPARPRRQHLGHLGLAHAGLALEQERALQGQGQEDGRGQALVGEVAVGGEGGRDGLDAQPAGGDARAVLGEGGQSVVVGRRADLRHQVRVPSAAPLPMGRRPQAGGLRRSRALASGPARLLQRPAHEHLGQVAAVLRSRR